MTTSAHIKLKTKLGIFKQEIIGKSQSNCETKKDKYPKHYTTSFNYRPVDSTEMHVNAHKEQAVIRHITVFVGGWKTTALQCQQETKQHTL